ncbi:polyprenyl synthetase family protein, partial [Chloroflexota bacterium]
MQLNAIYELIQEDLDRVENWLRSASNVDYPPLSELLDYSLFGSSKRIRPALVLLSGKFYNYNLDCLLPMATSVEMMHTATLVHDDAIDNSPLRRGRPTINEVWDADKAILLGDYLFAKAGELAADTQNLQVIRLFSQTLMSVSSGELNQAFSAFNLEQTRQQYFQRISKKTAALFVLAIESGAILSQAPESAIKILKDYGHNIGIAFQIVDDILDFVGSEDELGKPVGSDLTEGTLTLPAMLSLERYPENNPIRKLFQSDRDKQE